MEVTHDDQTVIVTGSSRGIGRAIASRFAAGGATVVLAARTKSELTSVAESIRADHSVDCLAVPTDLRDRGDIRELIDVTVDTFGAPNVLVNNAGANIVKPPLEHTDDEIQTMLDVNLRGLFLLSQEFGLAVRRSTSVGGRIINIASIASVLGVPAMTLYAGTKAGVRGITRGLAAELATDGITVNSVSPGLTRVDRTEAVIEDSGEELFDFDRIPLGRVGDANDVANVCLFLASEYADYITGEDILVDGGVSITAGLYK